MATYSRQYLQTFRINHNAIQIVDKIIPQVLQKAVGANTRYVYPWNSYNYGSVQQELEEQEKIVRLLKQKFPGVTVEYQEIKNINGKIERGIVIDWS